MRPRAIVSFFGWLLTLGFLAFPSLAVSETVKGKTTPKASSLSLLEEAERISRGFVSNDRASLLLEAADSASKLDRAQAERWALQLFTFSRTLEPGHYREAMEKNALTVLAHTNPVRAAQLFRQLDLPDVKEFPNEDVRAFAANTLFQALWDKKGAAALPSISELANWLGSTGQHPYPAVASLIMELNQDKRGKSESKTADSFFSDAISYLPRDPGYFSTNRNFANLILKVHEVVPQSLLRQAITQEVAAIQRTKDLRKGTSRYVVSGASGSHDFDSEGSVLIYRLLPVVEQMDPEWAAKLKNDFGLTDMCTPGVNEHLTVSGAITPPGQEQSATDADLRAAVDEHRLMQSQQLSATDPKAAVQLAQQITDPALRSVALVSAAPTYTKVDASKADGWVSAAREQLTSLPSGVRKLQLMIALIKVSVANGNRDDAQQQMGRAYDLGDELFEEDVRANPGKFSEMADGFNDLVDLTSVAARQPWLSGRALDHVRQVRNDVLRARLLVESAKGLAQQGSNRS